MDGTPTSSIAEIISTRGKTSDPLSKTPVRMQIEIWQFQLTQRIVNQDILKSLEPVRKLRLSNTTLCQNFQWVLISTISAVKIWP